MNMTARGFTLLELLIALVIATIIGVMLTFAVQKIITFNHQLLQQNTQWQNLDHAIGIIEADLQNLHPLYFNSQQLQPTILPPFTLDANLSFERNILFYTQAHELIDHTVRITYVFKHHKLVRLIWLDPSSPQVSQQQLLLDHVRDLAWQAYTQGGKQYASWPISHNIKSRFPAAIALHITLQNGQHITRWVMLHAV